MKTINAKNIKEAEELAVKLNLAENADFSDLDLSVVNTLLNELQKTCEIFKIFPTLKFIGSNESYYKIYHPKKKYKKVYNYNTCVAWEEEEEDFYDYSILINERYFNPINYKEKLIKFQKNIKENSTSSPINCHNTKAIINHEIGHILDFTLNAHNDRFIKNFFRMNHDKNNPDKMAAALSLYANTSTKEFIAEAWAEYCNNPTPRNVAKSVAEHLIYLYCSEVYSHPDDILNEQKKIIATIADQRTITTTATQQQEKPIEVKEVKKPAPISVDLLKKIPNSGEFCLTMKKSFYSPNEKGENHIYFYKRHDNWVSFDIGMTTIASLTDDGTYIRYQGRNENGGFSYYLNDDDFLALKEVFENHVKEQYEVEIIERQWAEDAPEFIKKYLYVKDYKKPLKTFCFEVGKCYGFFRNKEIILFKIIKINKGFITFQLMQEPKKTFRRKIYVDTRQFYGPHTSYNNDGNVYYDAEKIKLGAIHDELHSSSYYLYAYNTEQNARNDAEYYEKQNKKPEIKQPQQQEAKPATVEEIKTAKPVKTPKADGQQLLIDFSDSQEIITSKARTKRTRIKHDYSNQILINFD